MKRPPDDLVLLLLTMLMGFIATMCLAAGYELGKAVGCG